MSFTSPASACSLSVPPPQDWKMSGTFPPCIDVVSLDLKASFSSTVMLIFTLGCAAMYCLAASAQTDFIGSLFWMCHQSMVTGSDDLLAEEPLLLSSLLLPQAATTAASARDIAPNRTDFTIVSLLLRTNLKRAWPSLSLAGALTHHERCREFHATVLALTEDEAGRRRCHFGQRLTDRGQRWPDPAGHRQVVEPDDAELGGDLDALDAGRLVDAERLEVGAREDRGRWVVELEQLRPLVEAGLDVEGAPADQVLVDGPPGGFQRPAGALAPR